MWSWIGVILNKSTWSIDWLIQANWIWFILNIILIVFVFLRIISILRVAKDIISRTNNSWLQIISILLVTFLTPIIWLPLYHVIKPIYYKKDRIPRREACASSLTPCYNCGILNPKEYECCINCGEQLKIKCKECSNHYPQVYSYCNSCWAPNIDN